MDNRRLLSFLAIALVVIGLQSLLFPRRQAAPPVAAAPAANPCALAAGQSPGRAVTVQSPLYR